MYYWAHSEPIFQSLEALMPKKLTLEHWPPSRSDTELDTKEPDKDIGKLMGAAVAQW